MGSGNWDVGAAPWVIYTICRPHLYICKINSAIWGPHVSTCKIFTIWNSKIQNNETLFLEFGDPKSIPSPTKNFAFQRSIHVNLHIDPIHFGRIVLLLFNGCFHTVPESVARWKGPMIETLFRLAFWYGRPLFGRSSKPVMHKLHHLPIKGLPELPKNPCWGFKESGVEGNIPKN